MGYKLWIVIVCVLLIIISKFKKANNKKTVGIVSTMKQPKSIQTWLEKHRDIGIKHFYIRLEETPELEKLLEQQLDITLEIGKSNGMNEYIELQTRQEEWVNKALDMANKKGEVEWLVHIDCDELLHGKLDEIINLPDDVYTFWMENEEVKYHKVPKVDDDVFSNVATLTNCSTNGNKCISYVNGKGGGRVSHFTKCNDPHRFSCKKPNTKEIKLSEMKVHHYESYDFESYKEKFSRLANQDKANNIPFKYYTESISATTRKDEQELCSLYKKYRTVL